MNYSIIGEQIQKFRKETKLTQKELGEALGVSSSAVSQWETGGTPDISLLPAIADRLGVTINALFGREDVTQENIKEALPRYVASLPESKRLGEICRLMWEAMKSECTGVDALSQDISHNYKIYYISDEGVMLGTASEEMPFMSIFPEPEKGYQAFFAPDDQYRRLFSALSKPNALELLKLLYQRSLRHCTSEVIAKRLGIGTEETKTLLSEFAELKLVQELELETENGDTNMYIANDWGALVPFLYAARLLAENYGSYSISCNRRQKPLLRKSSEAKKGGKELCSDI